MVSFIPSVTDILLETRTDTTTRTTDDYVRVFNPFFSGFVVVPLTQPGRVLCGLTRVAWVSRRPSESSVLSGVESEEGRVRAIDY